MSEQEISKQNIQFTSPNAEKKLPKSDRITTQENIAPTNTFSLLYNEFANQYKSNQEFVEQQNGEINLGAITVKAFKDAFHMTGTLPTVLVLGLASDVLGGALDLVTYATSDASNSQKEDSLSWRETFWAVNNGLGDVKDSLVNGAIDLSVGLATDKETRDRTYQIATTVVQVGGNLLKDWADSELKQNQEDYEKFMALMKNDPMGALKFFEAKALEKMRVLTWSSELVYKMGESIVNDVIIPVYNGDKTLGSVVSDLGMFLSGGQDAVDSAKAFRSGNKVLGTVFGIVAIASVVTLVFPPARGGVTAFKAFILKTGLKEGEKAILKQLATKEAKLLMKELAEKGFVEATEEVSERTAKEFITQTLEKQPEHLLKLIKNSKGGAFAAENFDEMFKAYEQSFTEVITKNFTDFYDKELKEKATRHVAAVFDQLYTTDRLLKFDSKLINSKKLWTNVGEIDGSSTDAVMNYLRAKRLGRKLGRGTPLKLSKMDREAIDEIATAMVEEIKKETLEKAKVKFASEIQSYVYKVAQTELKDPTKAEAISKLAAEKFGEKFEESYLKVTKEYFEKIAEWELKKLKYRYHQNRDKTQWNIDYSVGLLGSLALGAGVLSPIYATQYTDSSYRYKKGEEEAKKAKKRSWLDEFYEEQQLKQSKEIAVAGMSRTAIEEELRDNGKTLGRVRTVA